uniref:Ferritin n=1 Tax=Rhodnius prolixus TaxID=13249 RepID=R4FJM3_RHOPR
MVLLNLVRLFCNKVYCTNFKPFLFKQLKVLKKPINRNYTCAVSGNKLEYNPECEKKINNQIAVELGASYTYFQLAFHFNKSTVGLKGLRNFFLALSEEEIEHARYLMYYQNLRGGKIILTDIKCPENVEWTALKALEKALDLEIRVTKAILDIHQLACRSSDPHLASFLETEFINEQYSSVRKLRQMLANLKVSGESEGLLQIDRELLHKYKPKLLLHPPKK